MHAVERDILRDCVGCFREGLSPEDVRLISYAAPVEGGENDRSALAEEDDADEFKRVVNTADGLDPPATQGMAGGWRGVARESRQMQRGHATSAGQRGLQ